MNRPIQTNQNPIECSTIAERDSVINDPRYRVAGLSVAVNGVLYWLNSDLQTWSPQKDTITGTVESYPNCKYVVKNPATWNPASFTAADLDGCSSVSVGDRILCPSGSSAGIWIASSSTAAAADSSFVTVEGYTVRCVLSAGSPTYRQKAADGGAPVFEIPGLVQQYRVNAQSVGGLIDDSVRVTSEKGTALLALREAVVRVLYGVNALPSGSITVTEDIDPASAWNNAIPTTLQNLLQVDRWVSSYPFVMFNGSAQSSSGDVFHFIPAARRRNELVVYTPGHSWTWNDIATSPSYPVNKGQGNHRWLQALLADGYDVLGVQMERSNEHNLLGWQIPATKTSHPIGLFLAHTMQALAHAKANFSFAKIYGMGISGGGWQTLLACAIDSRIDQGYSVCGSLPLYARKPGTNSGDYEQMTPDFYSKFGYLDLYALAALYRKFVHVWATGDTAFGQAVYPTTTGGIRSLGQTWADMLTDAVGEAHAAATPTGGSCTKIVDTSATTHQVTYSALGSIMHDMHPGTSYVYVPAGNALEKRLRSTGALVGSALALGTASPGPCALDWGKRIAVLDRGGSKVVVVDLDTFTIAATITTNVGSGPWDICYDGAKHWWVSCRSSNTVITIDIDTLAVDHTISIGAGADCREMDWDRGDYVWVTKTSSGGGVVRLSIADFTVHDTLASDGYASSVTYVVTEMTAGSATKSYMVVGCLTPGSPYSINKYRISDGTRVAQFACDAPAGIAWNGLDGTTGTSCYYVTSFTDKRVKKYNAETDALLATIALPASANQPRGTRWDGSGKIWVSNSGAASGEVFCVSTTDDSVTTIASVGANPQAAAWDGVFW